jgi:hypothetical protein
VSIAELFAGFPFAPSLDQPTKPGPPISTPPATEDPKKESVESEMGKVQEVAQTTAETLSQANGKADSSTEPPLLYDSATGEQLIPREKVKFMEENNRKAWANYRIGLAQGSLDDKDGYADCKELQEASVPPTWPTRIELNLVGEAPNTIIGRVKVTYANVQLTHGSENGHTGDPLILDLAPGEMVVKVRMSKGTNGISFVELVTSTGQSSKIGTENPQTIETAAYDGCVGLKGFYGTSSDVVDRMGPIWGK